jgi:hypothetical protein
MRAAAQVDANAAIEFQQRENDGVRLLMEKVGVARDWRGGRYKEFCLATINVLGG